MVSNENGLAVKKKLLQTGKEEMIKNSFSQVGVAKICSETGLAKGSFFYYFSSKEEFGIELFRGYMEDYYNEVESILFPSESDDKTGFERVWSLHRYLYEGHKKNNWKIPCLFMKVSAEVSGISDDIRKVISKGIDKVIGVHVAAVEKGMEDGSIVSQGFSAAELGKMIFMQWKGSAFISNVHLNDEALNNFFSYLAMFKGKSKKAKINK